LTALLRLTKAGSGWNPELCGAPVDGEWESLLIMRGRFDSSGRSISLHGRAGGKREFIGVCRAFMAAQETGSWVLHRPEPKTVLDMNPGGV